MKKVEINHNDELYLKADIKLTLVFGFLFCVALVLIIALPTAVTFFLKPTDGFSSRSLFILLLLFSPFLAISWRNILKYLDLKKGEKFRFETQDYTIKKKRDSLIIKTNKPSSQKFKIYHDVSSYIDINKPLKIEFAPLSKTLLFISHSHGNILDCSDLKDK